MRWLVAISATAVALLVAVLVYANSNCFENVDCSTRGQVAAWAMVILAGALVVEVFGAAATSLRHRLRAKRGQTP
jgi:hypothetical protein